MVPVITDQEYVESEDEKIGDGTGSDTTEELNFDDILDDVSEIPLEPLPGHEVLKQLPVDQDVLSQESSDDDYTDWPTIRPLRIDMGVPVRQEDYQPRGRGRPRKTQRIKEVVTGQKTTEPPDARSTGRGKTRSRSAPRREQMRPKSPEPKTEDELEPGELDKGDEEEDKEDQQRMEIEEELKYAITQAKEKELDLNKVERARQRIRQNKLIKKDWAAQRQSDLEAQHQLNLNEQEDPKTAQGILMKDNGPRESLTKSRPKVLAPSIPPDGASGTPACCGNTGHQGSPTQTGPLTWREPDRDASTVRLREKAGITKDGEEIMVIGSPTSTPTDTGRPKLKMSGILKEIPMTEIGMDKLRRNGIMTEIPMTEIGMDKLKRSGIRKTIPMIEIGTDKPESSIIEDTPLLIFSTMSEEMNNCRGSIQGGILHIDPTTRPQDRVAEHEPGDGNPVVPQVKYVIQRTAITKNRRSLPRCDRSPAQHSSARGQHASRDVSGGEVGQVKYGSCLPSAGGKSPVEEQTRQPSLQNRTARLRFKIKDGQFYHQKDGQFYHQTDGQPSTRMSPLKVNTGLKVPMTARGRAPPTLDLSGLDPEDLGTTVNKSTKIKASKTQNIQGQRKKGTRARKGPRPGPSIEWAQPHLYTPNTEAQTEAEAEAKQQGKGLGQPGQQTNPGHTLTTRTKVHSEPSRPSPQQERDNRFKWTVACFMINATALIVKLGDLVKSCQYPRDEPNPT